MVKSGNTRICEWDALPHPTYNLYSVGNASEVVPGISSPLFSTLGQQFEYRSAVGFTKLLGIEDVVENAPPPQSNWAMVTAGRWALNLGWFNAALGTLQADDSAAGVMDQFITSTDGHDISAKATVDKKRAARTLAKFLRTQAKLPMDVANDEARVDALRARERARTFTKMTDAAMHAHVMKLSDVCAGMLTRHLAVSLSAAAYQAQLGPLLAAVAPENPALPIMLTSALRDVESAKPAKGAWDVARAIGRRKKLASQVAAMSPNKIAAALRERQDADWQFFAEQFADFITKFGFRGMGEVDPSWADWEEEPAYALSTIKTFLSAGEDRNPHKLEDRAAKAREKTEKATLKAIPAEQREIYQQLLGAAQAFTRMREQTKANWVRGDRTIRRPVLELGRRFAERGWIAEPADIFWLIASEFDEGCHGELNGSTMKRRVTKRKAEAKRLEGMDLPEVYEWPVKPFEKLAAEATKVLTGLGVSAGTATGRARVILSTASALEVELEAGEVLVAPFTDAPWTPLFVAAAAVVVETGGILSHAATVAREYGIPAVVAVKGATKLISTGDLVTVDAIAGTVTLV